VHPIAFYLGSLPIRWYGVMMALGFFAGLWTATRRARRANVSGDTVADVTMWLLVGSIIGARTVYVITFWKEQFAGQPLSEIFMIQHGGLVYYGGLIGASITGIGYLIWKKLPVWKIADILAPSIALGSVFGRIGCLMNGCCYGRPCDLPWAIHFPASHETQGVGVHPTEIYDGALNLVLYLALAWWFRRKKFDGEIFALYLMGYAIFRSIAEMFRGDYPTDQIHSGLTPAQMLSIAILLAGIGLWFWRRSTAAKRGQKMEN
jgi:phosphatidylglycerol:prolipoprotein diacylglycerol transferase